MRLSSVPRAILGVALASAVAATLVACSINAATGERQFNALSPADEIALGTQEAPKFTAEFGGAVPDSTLQAYVTNIGKALAAKTEGDNPSLPWTFTLLNTDEINAFALPGGKVFFTRGLAERLTSEAQMASVLGHECGHVTARHTNSRMADAGITSLIVGGAAAVLSKDQATADQISQVGEQVGGVVLLKFSRNQESQADSLGMRYMSRANYNPRAQREVMEVLMQAMAGGRSPEILSSHPHPETRIERINAALAAEYASTQNNPQFVMKDKEYQTQFLPRLKALPRPAARPAASGANQLKAAPKKRSMIVAPPTDQALAIDMPATWCIHCTRLEAQTSQ